MDAYNYYKTVIVLDHIGLNIQQTKKENGTQTLDLSEVADQIQNSTKGQRWNIIATLGNRMGDVMAAMGIMEALEIVGIKFTRYEKLMLLCQTAKREWSEYTFESTDSKGKKTTTNITLEEIAKMFPYPTEEEVGLLNNLRKNMKGNKDVVVVNSGDRFDKLVRKYIVDNKKIEYMAEKEDWSEGRKLEAAQKYMKDFRDDIAQQLGIKDPTKLYPGQIIDFRKVKNWPQPNWFNWMINY